MINTVFNNNNNKNELLVASPHCRMGFRFYGLHLYIIMLFEMGVKEQQGKKKEKQEREREKAQRVERAK